MNNTSNATSTKVQWSFGTGDITIQKRPFNYYTNPGFYVPVFRYQFNHPSGKYLSASGAGVSGLDPMYGNKSIWLAESLLIGFNT
jgi:hypothetical protein